MALMIMTLLTAVGFVHANEFLKPPEHMLSEHVTEEDIRISLLEEVEGSLGQGSASKRLPEMEATLRPIFNALPKNTHGNLGHSAVTYALHRLFVVRHGWNIKGLTGEIGIKNASSPSGVLKDQVPAYIEDMFEKRLAGKGFALHDIAVLAATIEHLIQEEAMSHLSAAFNVHGLSIISPISEAEAATVLDTYMMAYIMGEDLNNMTLKQVQAYDKAMPEVFLAWRDTQKFVKDVRMEVTKGSTELSFASVAKVAEVVGERFGSFQNAECDQLKNTLVKSEHRGTGRVRLSEFYKPALDGSWTFQESMGYLRALGLLDESDRDQPSVMIANYITSQANCIASSGFYAVCCKNECEGLLGYLEEHIGASEATPAAIADLIAKLPSSTVPSQQIAGSLLQRLEEIAAGHNGMVPIHSRLFAQWMHHIYPRECPYPHVTGTADAKLPADFMAESGIHASATEEEMRYHVEKSGATVDSEAKYDLLVEDVMPWSPEQELVVVHSTEDLLRPQASGSAAMRTIALLGVASSLAFGLVQTMKAPLGQVMPSKSKYMV